jgi:tripartite-type tricarboxylate transporter receptor subunit TctC
VLDKVRQTPEWKKFLEEGAYNTTTMTGKPYAEWVTKNEQLHQSLMKEAGFLAASNK